MLPAGTGRQIGAKGIFDHFLATILCAVSMASLRASLWFSYRKRAKRRWSHASVYAFLFDAGERKVSKVASVADAQANVAVSTELRKLGGTLSPVDAAASNAEEIPKP